jgi:hypothetical protein
MSAEIKEFVKKLLSQKPSQPNSIQLEIDTDDDVPGLFEVLLTIMTEILKSWYPPPITIGLISEEDLIRLIDYFASFGILFDLDIKPELQARVLSNRDYLEKSRLEDMTFQMSHENKRYTVRFSNI